MNSRMTPFIAALAVLCGCSNRTPAATAAVPLYPYWTLQSMPAGPTDPRKAPPPAAGAVLVAKGYLVTTTYGMGDVADDFGMDPTVYVYDGTDWHQGRYVDRDKRFRIAIIRADVPGTPVRLARANLELVRVTALRPLAIPVPHDSAIGDRRCDQFPRWVLEDLDETPKPTLCFKAVVHDLAGGMFMDEGGNLAGLQVNPLGVGETAGPSADDIRSALDLYFATWGSAVKPKPTY
ncbi:MAG TPA: hypothetical protein VL500_02380 [Candidatus Eisenbacteria bacterium]|jgi:hypothetical protein|nr:hypothetical protein [Candidatus Eisenbacteria bacterium]